MTTIVSTNTTSRARWYYLAGALILIIGIAIFWIATRSHTARPSPAAKMTSVSQVDTEVVVLSGELIRRAGIGTVPVESKEFATEITAVGIFEIPDPNQRVISARASGRIERMFVASTGDYVRKGEPLFEFYSPDILNAEREFIAANSVTGMSHPGMQHTPGMDHSHVNEGLVRAGRKRLDLYGLTSQQINDLISDQTVANSVIVTAPQDGLVLEKLAQEGAYVNEGSSIFQLADLSTVWAEVAVPESYIRFVRVGSVMQVQTEAYPNESFAGRVIYISPIEDQTSRSVRVRLAMPNPSYRLRPQMTFTASIPISSGPALGIPASAVVRTGTADYVWIASGNDVFQRSKVTLGTLSSDNYYQVIDGLTEGDRVVAQGAFLVDAEYSLTRSNPMAGMNMGETGTKNSGEGTGTVRAINKDARTITLDHGAIPGVMPGMTMAYPVSNLTMLRSVTVNESVRFRLTRSQNGDYLITAIQQQ